MRFRSPIPDFQLANTIYVGATVTFYLADETGQSTGALATLYSQPTGSVTTNNPQVLDGDGKFTRPVYIDAAVIGEVTSQSVASHTTGVVLPRATYRGAWAAATRYYSGDLVTQTGSGGSRTLYQVAADYVSAATIVADIATGALVSVIGIDGVEADRIRAEMAADAAEASAEAAAQFDPSTYAPKASPVFTDNPRAPTPESGDNDTSIATTAFVQGEIAKLDSRALILSQALALTGTR